MSYTLCDNNNNYNNIKQFLYSAYLRMNVSMRLLILVSLVTGPISFMQSFSAPWGVYNALIATFLVLHQTQLPPSTLTGTHFIFLGEEKQFQLSVLLKDTSTIVVAGI